MFGQPNRIHNKVEQHKKQHFKMLFLVLLNLAVHTKLRNTRLNYTLSLCKAQYTLRKIFRGTKKILKSNWFIKFSVPFRGKKFNRFQLSLWNGTEKITKE